MAFHLIGPNKIAAVEGSGLDIFDLPARYGEPAAFLPQLRALFYESSGIQASSVAQFKTELERLLSRRRDEIEGPIMRGQRLHPTAVALQPGLLERFLLQDPIFRTLVEIIEVCEDCIENGASVLCEGD